MRALKSTTLIRLVHGGNFNRSHTRALHFTTLCLIGYDNGLYSLVVNMAYG